MPTSKRDEQLKRIGLNINDKKIFHPNKELIGIIFLT